MIRRRQTDDPDDTSALHREPSPFEGPISGWGQRIVGEIHGIRGDIDSKHRENTDRIGKLERSMFTEHGDPRGAGISRLALLESMLSGLAKKLDHGDFLLKALIGLAVVGGPIAAIVVAWIRK